MAVGNPITELSGPGDFVPVTRTLTINGVTYDLSANRSWTVSTGGGGTVTSVGLTMPTGFAVANSPVTTAGTLAVTFASGYVLPTTAKQTQWDSAYSFTSGFPTGTAQQLLRYNTLGTALEFFTPSFLTAVDINATTPLVWNSTTKTMSIPQANNTTNGFLTSADWLAFSSKQPAITLTTTGNSGAASLIGATLNVPEYTLVGLGGMANPFSAAIGQIIYSNSAGAPLSLAGNTTTTKLFLSQTGDGTNSDAPFWSTISVSNVVGAIGLTALSASSPLSYNNTNGAFSIQVATASQNGYLSSSDWVTFSSKQGAITLTTTGNSGSSTLIGNTLNVPTYTLAGLGGMTNPMTSLGDMVYGNAVGAPLKVAPNTTTTKKYLSMTGDGTSGAAPTWETVTGFLTGSGTTGTLLKFTGTGTVGDSLVSESGSSVYIGNGGSASEYAIQVGQGRSGNGYAYIDLIGDTTYSDYGLRLIRNNGGANTTSVIEHRGTGDFIFKTVDAAPFKIQTGSTDRMAMATSGQLRLHAYTSTTSFTGTAVGLLAYDAFGQVITQANLPQSGNYTPTLTGIANVNATTAYNCQYIRIGNVVSVSGRLEVDASVASTLTIVSLQLPYNTTFANAHQCNGVITAEDNICGIILGGSTAADLRFTPPNTGSFNYFFTLHFEII